MNAPVRGSGAEEGRASGGIGTRLERIGPYQVVNEIARLPGAALYEARTPDDQPVLVQIAHLRATRDDADRAARVKYERTLAARTAGLIDEPEIGVQAHGGADVGDGTRMLFWAVPMRGSPLPSARLDAGELLRLAKELCTRLMRRHARDRVEPLLSSKLIWSVDGNGTRDLAGVPLAISREWTAQGFDPSPLAPEELAGGLPTRAGDLWRLGRALLDLSGDRTRLPLGVRACLERLAADDVNVRPKTAGEALDLIEDARKTIQTTPDARPVETNGTHGVRVGTVDRDGHHATAPAPSKDHAGDGHSHHATAPEGAFLDWAVAVDNPERTPSAGVPIVKNGHDHDTATLRITPRPSTPPPETTLKTPDKNPPPLIAVGPEAVTRELRAKNVSLPSGEVVAVDPSEARTSLDTFEPLADGADLPTPMIIPEDPTPDPRRSIEPPPLPPPPPEGLDPVVAAAWTSPVIPEGASPWSEVVSARSAQRRASGEFKGFHGDLPDVVGDRVLAEQRITLPPPPAPKIEVEPPTLGAEIRAAARGFNRKKAGMGVAAFLVVFGFFAFVARNAPEPIEALEGLVATPANEVVVDTKPAGATVISEADGRVLGKAPLTFLVPTGADAVVLIAESGFEPQRLVLPDRGGIVASLVPAPPASCEINFDGLENVALEGVGVSIGAGPTYAIPGAAVVRVKDGDPKLAGARVVRCPEHGSTAQKVRFSGRRGAVQVRATHPPGATAWIDEREIGSLPASGSTEHSFARVRVKDADGRTLERWVPAATEVEVQLPPPVEATTPSKPIEIPEVPITAPSPAKPDKTRALELLKQGSQEAAAGRTQKARDVFNACLRVDPSAAECHKQLAQVYRGIGARGQAAVHYRRYLDLVPDAPDAALIKSIVRELE